MDVTCLLPSACDFLIPTLEWWYFHAFPPHKDANVYYPRIIKKKIEKALSMKSVLLLGPRQTGKSSLIKNELSPQKVFHLLDQLTFLRLSRRVSSLRESLQDEDRLIVIDEIQKRPQVMDEVHLMIEEEGATVYPDRKQCTKTSTLLHQVDGRSNALPLHANFCVSRDLKGF